MTTPTPATGGAPSRFFASYLDVVQYSAGTTALEGDNWVRRWQWIVMPRLPESNTHWLFYRAQQFHDHRALWKSRPIPNPEQVLESYDSTVTSHGLRAGRPPIVVELTLAEVERYVKVERKTPWEVLNRAKRISKRRYGFEI